MLPDDSKFGKKRKKRRRAVVIQNLDPGTSPAMEEGFLDFFRSLIDSCIPSFVRGGSTSSLAKPANTPETILWQDHDPGEDAASSMSNLADMGAPMLPAILFIVSLGLLVLSFFTGNFSFTKDLGERLKSVVYGQVSSNMMEPTARVWVNNENGTFYCASSLLFGNGAGEYMEQARALNMGYQPSLGNYCHGGQPPARVTPKRARGPTEAAGAAAGEPAGGARPGYSTAPPR